MKILEHREYSHILSWSASGNAIHVKEKRRFIVDILPILRPNCNYPSFVKQIKHCGFKLMKKRDGTEYLYSKRFTRHNYKSNPLFRKSFPKENQSRNAGFKPAVETYDAETIQMLNSCKKQFKLLNK